MAITKQRIKKIEQALSLDEDSLRLLVLTIVREKGDDKKLDEKTQRALIKKEIDKAKKDGTYKEPFIVMIDPKRKKIRQI